MLTYGDPSQNAGPGMPRCYPFSAERAANVSRTEKRKDILRSWYSEYYVIRKVSVILSRTIQKNCLESAVVRNFEDQTSMSSVTLGSLGQPSPDPGNLAPHLVMF